ncbi:MAG: hypothetical protein IPP42_25065 [Saprospiraceae bacterium]|nr:hypothetical protein [Saprospiraceae bacterium]
MGKNLEDHRLAILQLGRQYELDRCHSIGIFGHSAGVLMQHMPSWSIGFYKVAVASSADHDFRMERLVA